MKEIFWNSDFFADFKDFFEKVPRISTEVYEIWFKSVNWKNPLNYYLVISIYFKEYFKPSRPHFFLNLHKKVEKNYFHGMIEWNLTDAKTKIDLINESCKYFGSFSLYRDDI